MYAHVNKQLYDRSRLHQVYFDVLHAATFHDVSERRSGAIDLVACAFVTIHYFYFLFFGFLTFATGSKHSWRACDIPLNLFPVFAQVVTGCAFAVVTVAPRSQRPAAP